MKKAVVLVSGGVDSSTVLALVEKEGYEIYAISFEYMYRQALELTKIKQFIKSYNIKEHKIIKLDLSAFKGSALTDSEIAVPKYNTEKDLGDEIPVTYVPARNTIFLSYALGYAEVVGAYDIFIGTHSTDYANYPDCRPEYLESFENMSNLGTAMGVRGHKISIHAPFIKMTKSEIVKIGMDMGVDYSNTISCYDPNILGESCAKCHSCLTRIKAFRTNGVRDPILYAR